jgi:hypothetical protein
MNRFQENSLYFLRKERSNHWSLFGINNQSNKVYFLEIAGNYSTKTSILSIEEGRNRWRHLNANGFNKIELRDSDAIPFHLDQRIREWWRFVENGFKDNLYRDDPWVLSKVAWMPKTLKGIAEGKFSKTIDDYGSIQIANSWEYGGPAEDGSDAINNIHDEGQDDNYWNKETVFESASEKQSYQEWIATEQQRDEEMEWEMEEANREEFY